MKLKRLLSLLVLLAVVVTGSAQVEVNLANIQASDLEDDGETLIVTDGTTLTGTLNGETQPYKILIAAGAEVMLNGVTINGVNHEEYSWAGLTCLGNATITLSGTNTVKGFYEDYPGIYVPEGSKLIIDGNGSLTASSNGWGAGIGGGYGINCGNIEIQGGSITAAGGTNSAGIGGGDQATCGDIIISGGNIEATGGNSGAGIGSGYTGTCSSIAISGGSVTAFGGQYATGIGCGDEAECGDITISGGTIEATGGQNGAGIGTGSSMNGPSSCGDITIENTVTQVTATAGAGALSSIGIGDNVENTCSSVTIGGTVYPDGITTSPATYSTTLLSLTVTQGDDTQTFYYADGETWEDAVTNHFIENNGWSVMGEAIVYDGYSLYSDGAGTTAINPTADISASADYFLILAPLDVDLSTLTKAYTFNDGDRLTGELDSDVQISIAAGATVTLAGVIINGVNDESYPWAGLTCLGDATIILEDGKDNSVTGFYVDYPGIFVPSGSKLTIQGGTEGTGTLTARSNGSAASGEGGAAGIGGGYDSNSGFGIDCGDIEIQGGTITASSPYMGAGIGSGVWGTCGDIIISGGTVNATGGAFAAGIGTGSDGGYSPYCGDITISGGTVTAFGGDNGAGIGTGSCGYMGSITISGGTVDATGGTSAPGIGYGVEGSCEDIEITDGVTIVFATKGEGASYSLGAADNYGVDGTITIGGKEYYDGADYVSNRDTYLAISTFVYPYWIELMEIDDPLAVLTAQSGNKVPVWFTRSGLTAGAYSTICLPFDFTAPTGCTFYTFTQVAQDGDGVWYADVTAVSANAPLSANTPYIFTSEEAESVDFTNEEVVAADSYDDTDAYTTQGDWTFQGTYAPIALPKEGEYAYGFTSAEGESVQGKTLEAGTFVHLVSGATAAPFRAYLKYTGDDEAWKKSRTRSGASALPSRITVRIVGADGNTTEIGTLSLDTEDGEWFSLDGRRLVGKPAAKGIYIKDGKKVIVK